LENNYIRPLRTIVKETCLHVQDLVYKNRMLLQYTKNATKHTWYWLGWI